MSGRNGNVRPDENTELALLDVNIGSYETHNRADVVNPLFVELASRRFVTETPDRSGGETSSRATQSHSHEERRLVDNADSHLNSPDATTSHEDAGEPEQAISIPPMDMSTLHRTPIWNLVVNGVTYMAAPMAMPSIMAQANWYWGTAALLYSSIVTYHTGLLIGDICLANPHIDSYPKLVEEGMHKLVAVIDPEKAAKGGARKWTRIAFWATLWVQFMTYYLDTVAQIIYVEQYFGELLPGSPICQWKWLLITWVISIPVMQIPTLHSSRYVCLFALGCVLATTFSIFAEVYVVQPWNCLPGPSYPKTSPMRLFTGFAGMAYAFGGHGIFPEEIREMKEPEKWPIVMNWTYGIIVPMYLACSFVGYYAYGGYAQANLNLNFPDNWINTFSLLVQLPSCLYLIYFTNLVLVLQIELALGVDPTHTTCARPFRFGMPPVLFRFFFRSLFVGSQVLFAEILLSGAGDTVLGVQALAGAVGMVAFTYFLPFILHAIFFWEDMRTRRLVYYAINAALAIVFMFGGIYSTSVALIQEAGGFMDGECHLTYKYAPYSPEDPCFISGIS
eukprot:CAMPEP_0198202528 /NCGR_PEP_ID=MMETSP1445-20131203/5701_1 /TAXON_ID=36898 /ORGANISM="Pyramimonas sp., Strain CCMP2087" /LENGTH=561 /DNA_ID=CAMNT_0043873495 /DNA_START=248 /DNA_END=1933 /DNA_ORIENTATION=-